MNDLIKVLAVAGTVIALSVSLLGCGESSESKSAETHSANDGHDHAGDGDDHKGHDHAEGEHGDHGAERNLGSVTIAGTTLRVSMGGEIEPSGTVHLDIERTDGPEPAAIRVWIGDEAGTGALKSKAMGSGGDYHADAEVPADVSLPTSLWIEVETADGIRESGSITIN